MANRKTDTVEGGPKGIVRIGRMRVRKRMREKETDRGREGKRR